MNNLCRECNSLLDDYDIEVCASCKKELAIESYRFEDDLEKLGAVLDELRWNIKSSYGLNAISGGFCNAEYVGHDEDDHVIHIEVKVGVQNDCENNVSTEDYQLNYWDFMRYCDGQITAKECEQTIEPCN